MHTRQRNTYKLSHYKYMRMMKSEFLNTEVMILIIAVCFCLAIVYGKYLSNNNQIEQIWIRSRQPILWPEHQNWFCVTKNIYLTHIFHLSSHNRYRYRAKYINNISFLYSLFFFLCFASLFSTAIWCVVCFFFLAWYFSA